MPIASIDSYLQRLPGRMAELKMAIAEGASVPHMKQSGRSAQIKEWQREIAKYAGEPANVVSPARLKLIGIGVSRGK